MKGQTGYGGHATKPAPAQSRPEPEPFVFRRQHPGESDAEYKDLETRARERHNRTVDRRGRAKAVKGKLMDVRKDVTVEPSS